MSAPPGYRCTLCGGNFLETEPHDTVALEFITRRRVSSTRVVRVKKRIPDGPCPAPGICKRLGLTAEQLRETFAPPGDA